MKRLLGLLFLLIGLCPGASGQTSAPNLSAGEERNILQDFLVAYSDGSIGAFNRFCERNYAPQRLTIDAQTIGGCGLRWLQLRTTYGEVRYDRTERRSFGDMHWFRSEAIGVYFGVAFGRDDAGRVIWQAIDHSIIPNFVMQPRRLQDLEAARWLAGYARRLERSETFSGVILVGRRGRIVSREAIGMANREAGQPVRPSTSFNVASVSKMFTATAILRLVEERRLSLDDTLDRFLPDYPREIASLVTIRHLLTHTSGIELDDSEGYNAAADRALSLEDQLRAQIEHITELNDGRYENFTPLNEFDYTNEGYALLGAILESITGQAWSTAVDELVFKPAGMTHTRPDISANSAIGYTLRREAHSPRLGPAFTPNTALIRGRADPAGSFYTEAVDLLRFCNFVQRRASRPMSIFRAATQIQAGEQTDPTVQARAGYGYGFQVSQTPCGTSYGHSGAVAGANAVVRHWPDSGLTIVVLSNKDGGASEVSTFLSWRLTGCS